MKTPADIRRFLTAGKAVLTLKSEATQKHYTYLAETSDDGNMLFVKVLTGPDNLRDFTYLGYCYIHATASDKVLGPMRFGAKGQPDHTASRAWQWASERQFSDPKLSVYHEGRCGACGRRLTTPESVELGIGPECIKKVM